jgi:RNA-directed DNA polymerase
MLSCDRQRLHALADVAEDLYRKEWRTIRGKRRFITEPFAELKALQRTIRERLLLPVPLSSIVYSDTRGRSATANARQHLHQSNLASVDIRDCYPSITNAMVFRVFREQLHLGDNLARLLTPLTTLSGHLPQGTPTSGALANLVLSPVDVWLEEIAARLELIVTRYVDNIDFSGVRSREAILPTISVLQRHGFAVRHKKVFNAGYAVAHVVTGNLVDGREVRLPRTKRANVRAAVHEIIQRNQEGLPIADRALNRLRGRLVHLRTHGHTAEERRLVAQLGAARVLVRRP